MLNRDLIHMGINPIVWSNDDFDELGDDIPLEQCLMEARDAGYEGIELGHKFSKNPSILKPLLDSYSLKLISGWHSCYLATQPFEKERQRFLDHLHFLKAMGCAFVIVAECGLNTYTDRDAPLGKSLGHLLSNLQWQPLLNELDALAKISREEGLTLVYHPHAGTIIQTIDEIDRLMTHTQHVQLLLDTGHSILGGFDPIQLFEKHSNRISHIHLKSIRPKILEEIRSDSFASLVKRGIFTVPGDPEGEGCIHFPNVFEWMEQINYSGWLVVEAEQDPRRANPLEYASLARQSIRTSTGI